MSESLRVTEIFHSLQGESSSVGVRTVFIRLTGCPLRCGYCDTSYAFSGGNILTLEEIVHKASAYNARHVTVTGGEPLAQPACLNLLSTLCERGFIVSLETSGALDVSNVDTRVIKIMDLKTPGSGEAPRNLYGNINYLVSKDEVKFVICNREDYEWSRFKIDEYQLADRVDNVLMSACHEVLDSALLAEWILEDQLDVRLQIQLHKYLWGDIPGV